MAKTQGASTLVNHRGDHPAWRGWQAGGREGRGGGGGLCGAPCTSAEGGRYGHPPCAVSSGWSDVLHPFACQYWVEQLGVSTSLRVRWVLRLCSQPPPRYQSWGHGSASIAAPGPQRMYRRWCTRCSVAALALLLHCSLPSPWYQQGGMGVHHRHSSRSAHTAALAARVSQQFWHCIRTIAKPAPLCTMAQGRGTSSRRLCTAA